jgi:hypothetical protein
MMTIRYVFRLYCPSITYFRLCKLDVSNIYVAFFGIGHVFTKPRFEIIYVILHDIKLS